MERVLVLGLGKTGRSVLRFFSKKEEVIVGGYAEYLKDEERSELAKNGLISSEFIERHPRASLSALLSHSHLNC